MLQRLVKVVYFDTLVSRGNVVLVLWCIRDQKVLGLCCDIVCWLSPSARMFGWNDVWQQLLEQQKLLVYFDCDCVSDVTHSRRSCSSSGRRRGSI